MASSNVMVVLRGGVVLRARMDQDEIDDIENALDSVLRGTLRDDALARSVAFGKGTLDLLEIVGMFKGDDAAGDVQVVSGGGDGA